jgi:hypothetical protein
MMPPYLPKFLKESEPKPDWKPALKSQRFLASTVADRRCCSIRS